MSLSSCSSTDLELDDEFPPAQPPPPAVASRRQPDDDKDDDDDANHGDDNEKRPASPTDMLLATAGWDDVTSVQGADGKSVLSISGLAISSLSWKRLRVVCSRLKVGGVKNVKKPLMIDAIEGTYINRKGYVDVGLLPPTSAAASNNNTNPASMTALIVLFV